MLRRNYRCLFLYDLNMGTGTRINLVNKSVSRETSMLAANGLTPIGNEKMSAIGRHFWCVMMYCREIVCCLPSYPTRKASGTGQLLVGQPHFGLRPVRLDRLRICPLQCRQRQQNISLGCVHKDSRPRNFSHEA